MKRLLRLPVSVYDYDIPLAPVESRSADQSESERSPISVSQVDPKAQAKTLVRYGNLPLSTS